jgi:asparagine synthase (glutamine-hydrolysing)
VCGIALIAGPGASEALFTRMLDVLAPRGEVREVCVGDALMAGTQRLRITDQARAIQPWLSADERWLLCYNGEIYNHRALRSELRALGSRFRTESDTEVVMAAFARWGEQAVRRLRGEFAFAISERSTGRTYLARDALGVKPLYWSEAGGCLHVASEIKALVPTGARVRAVPPGGHGWAGPGHPPRLSAFTDLLSPHRMDAEVAPLTDAGEAAALIRSALADAIAVRADTDLPVGVILSGGLDSSLTLAHVAQLHKDCVAFTVGAPGSQDIAYASKLAADLGVRHEVIEISPRTIRLAHVKDAIRISELTEYGDIINAVVSVPLFRRVADAGIKVVLTGDGSDELFGGYAMYDQIGQAHVRRLFLHKLANLHRTELQRVDRTAMAAGVEVRVPFLDPVMVDLAMRLPMALKLRDGVEKWILRQAFADLLPGYIRQRPKNPMSHASGLHERARLYKPAFARIHRSFGYQLHEPVRRDFSVVLTQCGNDLDLATSRARARRDYNAREHARDLAGAAKWNAAAVMAGRPRRGLTSARP